jgi:hypothetical protein
MPINPLIDLPSLGTRQRGIRDFYGIRDELIIEADVDNSALFEGEEEGRMKLDYCRSNFTLLRLAAHEFHSNNKLKSGSVSGEN